MARNLPKQINDQPEPGQPVVGEVPPLKGGTLGVTTTQTRASALPATMGRQPVDARAATGRQYKVTAAPNLVTYPGQGKTRLPVGKIVSDASCDLDVLRRQGVELQEIARPLVAECRDGEPAKAGEVA
jgi:hypothetical protein